MNPAVRALAVALIFGAPLSAFAAEADKDVFTGGDPSAGATKAAVCAACHGPAGKSTMPDWPKLAGQGSVYVAEQLRNYKSGARKDPVMAPMAAPLSEQDIKDLAAYFAAQEFVPGVASEDAIAVAEPIYGGGIAERGVPACLACHGPTGAGNEAAGYPRLSGQHASYTAAALRKYRAGERNATTNGQMMSAVAKSLTDQEIEALASYINGLQ